MRRPFVFMVLGWLSPAAVFGCQTGSSATQEDGAALRVTRGVLSTRSLLTGELDAVTSESLSVPRTPQWNLSVRWLAPHGSEVNAGDRVAELDNAAFIGDLADRKLQLARARADLERQLTLDAALTADRQIELQRAETAFEKARLRAAVSSDALAKRTYEERQLARERARTELATAKDALATHERSAKLEVEVRQIAIDKIARDIETAERAMLAVVLRAPKAGTVLIERHPGWKRRIEVGDNVWPGLALARLPDVSRLHVNAQVSDIDDGQVSVGMSANVVLDAYPDRSFPGTIAELSPVAREPFPGAQRRFIAARVSLLETDLELMRPGMSARVEVASRALESELTAPRAAIDLTGAPARLRLASGALLPISVLACNLQSCAFRELESGPGQLQDGVPLAAAPGGDA